MGGYREVMGPVNKGGDPRAKKPHLLQEASSDSPKVVWRSSCSPFKVRSYISEVLWFYNFIREQSPRRRN